MSDSGVSNPKGSGVADAGANAGNLVRQRTSPSSSSSSSSPSSPSSGDQSCSAAHNGVVLAASSSSLLEEEEEGGKRRRPCEANGRQQCSLHLWSKKALLNRREIPKHLQFNPYIETGYRPLLSVWGCLMSLFYFHNETINIITHGESHKAPGATPAGVR